MYYAVPNWFLSRYGISFSSDLGGIFRRALGRGARRGPACTPRAGSDLKPDCSSELGIRKKKKIDFVVRF